MYINTEHSIGATVYFLAGGSCVIRGEVREIHISKYESGQSVLYQVRFVDSLGEVCEERHPGDSLHRSPDHAFWQYDERNKKATEPEAAAA